MKKLFVLFLLSFKFLFCYSSGKDQYSYTVNLVNVVNDKVQVVLVAPEIDTDSAIFFLPKIIPGTYQISDFGRFISKLKAFDSRGQELEVEKTGTDSWVIRNARRLKSLSYWVDDTFDADMGDNKIYNFSGTDIESGKVFVISPGGYFGYFSGMKELPFEVTFIKPGNFYGSTGLRTDKVNLSIEGKEEYRRLPKDTKMDVFNTEDYNSLIDSPFMYNIPDTTSVNVAGTQVLISVYSPGHVVSSGFVASNIKTILNAQKDYLGGQLPVDKYAFILYFEDLSRIADYQGALEHSYSSFYYLPNVRPESLIQSLRDIAAHEFFHIVTPLSIHSEEIEYFDYNDPKMSEHLWLYEGVTEYFAGHVQVKYGIITLDKYLEMLRMKIVTSKREYNDSLPFTDLSKYTLNQYQDQYNNVYEKGALIGLCLDIRLRQLSEGKYGLRNLLDDLSEKYGKHKPFKDDNLFSVIGEMTYPEIGEFLQTYVGGSAPLPLEQIFASVGINYTPFRETKAFTLGSFGIALEGHSIIVEDVSDLDPFGRSLGYKKGDVIQKLQGRDMPENPFEINDFIQSTLDSMVEGEDFSVTVLRKNAKGKEEPVTLTAKAIKIPAYEMYVLKPDPLADKKALLLRKYWLDP